jgi:hypothetical protein
VVVRQGQSFWYLFRLRGTQNQVEPFFIATSKFVEENDAALARYRKFLWIELPGGYYGPDGIAKLNGHPTAVRVAKGAMDPAVAKRFWCESERLTKVKFGALSDVV